MNQTKSLFLSHSDLKFDEENIRFFHLDGHSSEEALLIVAREAIQKLINSMIERGFDYIHPLHINMDNVVKDGNSRLLAYKIALGVTQYQDLVKKYSIKGFGELKNSDGKVDVVQYKSDEDLKRFIESTHLIRQQNDWSASAKYTYYYVAYTQNLKIGDYPPNWYSMVKSIQLFLHAINFEEKQEVKEEFQKAYENKASTLLRAFSNTKLHFKNEKITLTKLMDFQFDESREFKYNNNLSEKDYKIILSEIAIYVVKNSIGSKEMCISNFPKSFEILKKIFQIKVIKPSQELTKDKKKSTVKKIIFSHSVFSNNLSRTRSNLKKISGIKGNDAVCFYQRALLENTFFVLGSIFIKRVLGSDNFDFIDNSKTNKNEIIIQLDESYRGLYNDLYTNYNSLENVNLSKMMDQLAKKRKEKDKNTDNYIFNIDEQAFLKELINVDIKSYIENLNKGAHARWNIYESDKISKSFYKLIDKMIPKWQKNGEW